MRLGSFGSDTMAKWVSPWPVGLVIGVGEAPVASRDQLAPFMSDRNTPASWFLLAFAPMIAAYTGNFPLGAAVGLIARRILMAWSRSSLASTVPLWL